MNYNKYTRHAALLILSNVLLAIMLWFAFWWGYTWEMRYWSMVESEGRKPAASSPFQEGESGENNPALPPSVAKVEPVIVNTTLHYRITCYGPPPYGHFPLDSVTASGVRLDTALMQAEDMGLDGICAVSPDTPWYRQVGEVGDKWVVHVDGFGAYLAVDRTASWVRGVIDIYNPEIAKDNQWNVEGVECYGTR